MEISEKMTSLVTYELREVIYESNEWDLEDESIGYTRENLEKAIEKTDLSYEEAIKWTILNFPD